MCLGTIVEPHHEQYIKAMDVMQGMCIIIEEYEKLNEVIDAQISQLWERKPGVDEPLVAVQELVRTLFKIYGHDVGIEILNIISVGIMHFFDNITKTKSQGGYISLDDFKLFLKFFGPTHLSLSKVFYVYREPYFHGFLRHSEAVELLKGRPGAFLVRFSESQLKDGFFAFNVNKGNNFKDVVENYSLKYRADLGAFYFRGRAYDTLRDFVSDPDHSNILKQPLMKTDDEQHEAKYRSDTDFLINSFETMNIHF
eukprot:TRINITY_DN4055_c0_g1_i1.p1 TRINITY_DN4055_c0_g1~~TRINITY_DN4055_c0_g1_i1.p1  ORF type:complete len:254 (+),score=50.32 TRINITY_DN4055_c0_g1_i1:382-1143(+)